MWKTESRGRNPHQANSHVVSLQETKSSQGKLTPFDGKGFVRGRRVGLPKVSQIRVVFPKVLRSRSKFVRKHNATEKLPETPDVTEYIWSIARAPDLSGRCCPPRRMSSAQFSPKSAISKAASHFFHRLFTSASSTVTLSDALPRMPFNVCVASYLNGATWLGSITTMPQLSSPMVSSSVPLPNGSLLSRAVARTRHLVEPSGRRRVGW